MFIVSNTLLKQLLGYFAQTEQFAFFDTSRPCDENRQSYLFVEPLARLQCPVHGDLDTFLDEIRQWLDKGCYIAGWFGYEFGYLLDRHLAGLTSGPVGNEEVIADLGVYREPCRFHHDNGEHGFGDFAGKAVLPEEYSIQNLRPNISEQEYLNALGRVKEYICAGDTYQVNLTLKLLFDMTGSPEALYRDLRRNQSVAYGAYIRWGEKRVMSFSPELFFRKEGPLLTAKPMKGTLRRGRNLEEDAVGRRFSP